MKTIHHRSLKWEKDHLTGDAFEHIKGEKAPDSVNVKGKYYNVIFDKHKAVRDRENSVLRHVYKARHEDPRVASCELHFTEALTEENDVEE